jgi:hypothetical protein
MKRVMLLIVGCLVAPLVGATTYTYTAPPFTGYTPFYPPCVTGPCANVPTGAMLSGWFTTASPLVNVPKNWEISSSVTSFYFTDGINTYSSTDPNVRVYTIQMEADAFGNIGFVQIQIAVWKTGTSPHAPGDRYSELAIASNVGSGTRINVSCHEVGVGNANVPDTCTGSSADSSSSEASGPYGSWSTGVIPVVGLWWNPLESGSGYNIDVKHGILVMTVYSYLPSGEQAWYITSGPIVDGSFTGTLDRYVGGQCIACTYNGLPTSAGSGGAVTVNFTSPTSATMYLPGGRVTNIQPEPF